MCKVTAIVNQKGGVGKTTTALNLGYALSERGKKVLLIDFDPQASLTAALGQNADNKPNIQTLMANAIEEKNTEENYITLSIKNNLDLIPSSLELAGIEMTLVNVMSRENILKIAIEEIKDKYDYILIDCSPSLGTLTINALTASDSVIIPVTPEFLSAKGLGLLIKNIRKIKKRVNPAIEVDGILITMTNERTNLSKSMIQAIKDSTNIIEENFGIKTKAFKTTIPISIKAGESILNKKSIIEYFPNNKVSLAYQKFAKEWEERE
jgi:chromosome partitioning protein